MHFNSRIRLGIPEAEGTSAGVVNSADEKSEMRGWETAKPNQWYKSYFIALLNSHPPPPPPKLQIG